jgi:hypothetical protein
LTSVNAFAAGRVGGFGHDARLGNGLDRNVVGPALYDRAARVVHHLDRGHDQVAQQQPRAPWTASPESRELLGEHFAKGEIDRNEYVERSKTFDLTAAAL